MNLNVAEFLLAHQFAMGYSYGPATARLSANPQQSASPAHPRVPGSGAFSLGANVSSKTGATVPSVPDTISHEGSMSGPGAGAVAVKEPTAVPLSVSQ